ncbi:MAG: type 4 pilus major pilin [Rhodospirillales bacterium]|nr:type 4 pilus major pilin [Rhodospirillales bacterium]
MMKMRSEQTGRSMVEMLGVLAIIGVLSVGGIAGYSKAMSKYKLTKAMDQVSTTVTNIRTLYSGQPNYDGLTTTTMIQMGAVGAEMLNGKSPTTATAAYNAFNGAVTIDGAPAQTFKIKFDGLSKDACVAIASSDWGSGSGSGLVSITTGPTAKTGTTAAGTLPLKLSDAAAGCNGVGDTNSVTWEYY